MGCNETKHVNRELYIPISISHPVLARDQYQQEGRRPEDWYWLRADTGCDVKKDMNYYIIACLVISCYLHLLETNCYWVRYFEKQQIIDKIRLSLSTN